MTQIVAQIRNVVARTGFANPLTLGVLVEDTSQLRVFADNVELQIGDDYVVGGIGDPDGIEITIIGAEDVNEYVGFETFTALYDPPLSQGSDLSAGGNFGRAFETALDQQNRRLQALADRVERSLKVGISASSDGTEVTPVPGYGLGWDDDGNLVALAPEDLGLSDPIVASAVSFSPVGSVSSTQVQAALAEIIVDLDTAVADLLALTAATQPLDSDLSSIAALSPTTGDMLHYSGGWVVKNRQQTLEALAAQSISGHSNLSISASVSGNALTVSVKGADGNAPSAANPVCLAFRDATQTSGLPVVRTVTAALSVSLPNGATVGFASGSAGRLWVVAFDDGGTVRLGLINCLSGASIYPLRSHRFASSTATGTGSDNAHTFYTTTAVTSKPYIVLGHLDWSGGLATAGTWASAPTLVQTLTPHVQLPGDLVQVQRTDDGAAATGSTGISFDDSVPQNTEGDQFLSQAITVQAAPNVLQTRSEVMLAVSNQTAVTMALFRDSTAAALAACGELPAAANNPFVLQLHHAAKAGAAATTTMKVRLGRNASGTVTLNGAGGGRSLGGVANSFIEVSEIVA